MEKCRDCANPRAHHQLIFCNPCFEANTERVERDRVVAKVASKAEQIASMKHRFGNVLDQIPADDLRAAIATMPPPIGMQQQTDVKVTVDGLGELKVVVQANRIEARGEPVRYYWKAWRASRE